MYPNAGHGYPLYENVYALKNVLGNRLFIDICFYKIRYATD